MKTASLPRLGSILLLLILPALMVQTACSPNLPPTSPAIAPATSPATVPATSTAPAPKTRRYTANIERFAELDRKSPPPAHPTVFLGSSTFTRWSAVPQVFQDYKAINRGFGGSSLADILYFFDRLVTPYEPRAIVLYIGTNDITGGTTPEKFLANFKTFHHKVQAVSPDTHIYFISLIPAPIRESKAPAMDQANQLVRDYIVNKPQLHYIDARFALSTPEGKPDPAFYVADRLHPNEKGYAILAPLIKAALGSATTQAVRP